MFNHLLDSLSFQSLKYQVLLQITEGLRGNDTFHTSAHHFLHHLQGVGEDSMKKLQIEWEVLYKAIVKVIDDEKAFPFLRIAALNALNLEYLPKDIPSLLSADVFRVLLRLVLEESKESSQVKLKQPAWLLFRLIVIQVLKDTKEKETTETILTVLSDSLSGAIALFTSGETKGSESGTKRNEIETHCSQVLLLFLSVSINANCRSFLSQQSQLQQLMTLVKHGPSYVKILCFRILRAILPDSKPKEVDETFKEKTLTGFLFEIIGVAYATSATIFSRRMNLTVRLTRDILTVAEEAVTLIRHLMEHSSWKPFIANLIVDGIQRIPVLVQRDLGKSSPSNQDDILTSIASLCILGGDIPSLRLGSRIIYKSTRGGQVAIFEKGTVIEYNPLSQNASVVLDSGTQSKPMKRNVSRLTPTPEVTLPDFFSSQVLPQPSIISISEILPLFKFFYEKKSSDDMLYLQLKARLTKVLTVLVTDPHSLSPLVDSPLLSSLSSVALQPLEKSHLNLEQLEKVSQTLQEFLLAEKATVSGSIGRGPCSRSLQECIDEALANGSVSPSEYRQLRLEFAQLDLNGDGLVTVEEFKEANRRRGSPVSESQLEEWKKPDKSINFLDFVSLSRGKPLEFKEGEND